MEPIYKLLLDYEGYRIGSDGTVWTCWRFKGGGYGRPGTWHMSDRWRQLRPSVGHHGYLRVRLRTAPYKYRHRFIHNLAIEAFVGPKPKPKMQCCHQDGNTQHNCATNLYWGTCWQNHQDKKKHGTTAAGSKNWNSKLKEADVLAIRQARVDGTMGTVLARKHGVTPALISAICYGKIWTHIGGPLLPKE